MDLTSQITESWGWTGISPAEVVLDNEFGNLIIKDQSGTYWRLCPEELYCSIVASSREEIDSLLKDQDFLHDWYMAALVQRAKKRAGALLPGYKYCLKIPGPLGGEYDESNLASVSLLELVSVSGHLAKQIEDLPDGAQIELRVTE